MPFSTRCFDLAEFKVAFDFVNTKVFSLEGKYVSPHHWPSRKGGRPWEKVSPGCFQSRRCQRSKSFLGRSGSLLTIFLVLSMVQLERQYVPTFECECWGGECCTSMWRPESQAQVPFLRSSPPCFVREGLIVLELDSSASLAGGRSAYFCRQAALTARAHHGAWLFIFIHYLCL